MIFMARSPKYNIHFTEALGFVACIEDILDVYELLYNEKCAVVCIVEIGLLRSELSAWEAERNTLAGTFSSSDTRKYQISDLDLSGKCIL